MAPRDRSPGYRSSEQESGLSTGAAQRSSPAAGGPELGHEARADGESLERPGESFEHVRAR